MQNKVIQVSYVIFESHYNFTNFTGFLSKKITVARLSWKSNLDHIYGSDDQLLPFSNNKKDVKYQEKIRLRN